MNQHVEQDAPLSRAGSIFGLGLIVGYLVACLMCLLMLAHAAR